MDPFSAMILAALVTWGTAGGGIKDTSAILKGSTPPSVAYRTAKLAADEKRWQAWEKAVAEGKPVPAALEPRRIRIKDLVRHWWEDALEDADAWRARRRLSRPERKAARAARKAEKEGLVKKGYALIEERGAKRFGQAKETPDEHVDAEPAAQVQQKAPDNVVPLRPRIVDGPEPLDDDEDKDEGAPGHGVDDAEELVPAKTSTDNTDHERARELVESLRTTNKEMVPVINLSDAETLDAHLAALDAYAQYLDRIANDMDALSAGMASHAMGSLAVMEVSAAGASNTEAALKCRGVREDLERAHTVVADARAATPDAADGDYLTRGR